MLTKFEDEVRECKQYWLEKMCLKKIKLNKVLNKEKMDTMRRDMSKGRMYVEQSCGSMYVVMMLSLIGPLCMS